MALSHSLAWLCFETYISSQLRLGLITNTLALLLDIDSLVRQLSQNLFTDWSECLLRSGI